MKKRVVSLSILLVLASLSLVLVPGASSKTEDIKVLSYTWYSGSYGSIIAAGEVQNVGSSTISKVILGGTIFSADGVAEAYSVAQVGVINLVPQQKAPFYMQFDPGSGSTGDINWLAFGIDHISFNIVQAGDTSYYQYPDVKITTSSGAANSQGQYWVTGTIQNTGTETAKSIRVMATFYNSTGNVVAVGYTGDTPVALALSPGAAVSFRVTTLDLLNQTLVPASFKIQKYSLVAQAAEPVLSGASPSASNNTSTSTSDGSSSSTDTDSATPNSDGAGLPWGNYAIAVVVVLAIIGVVLLLRRRKTKPTEIQSQVKTPKTRSKRKKR